jgi:hypothetical protein
VAKQAFCPLLWAGQKASTGGDKGTQCKQKLCKWWIETDEENDCALVIIASVAKRLEDIARI